ncbi:GGDEF domain-containing protein [Billgrantia tianxiuensis]|jgi:diguanylate cyclase (GGDEF)-like protein|uniref:diguanylate cyclase n=1 Tax=Billgrantia tianxiuensis TaxID=2497861 RepID=A0A6I6SIP0_9GAMM|nr:MULTISPECIES: GGDEF domain-containing protein [Halomonas]MCE8034511.1 GGDEF domain-containing protein [Halomonas sp. MCCC 1A11057]QHC50389.1 GGDEF domain-containing protein [Halomonas tianxiuensis]
MHFSKSREPREYQNRRLDALAEPPEVGHELFVGLSALRDTLSSRHHSRDFTFAHARYLRSRVLALGLIFALLSPLWIVVDSLVLPTELLRYTLLGRVVLLLGLVGVLALAYFSRERIGRIRFSAGMLLALPAGFYLLVLSMLPPEQVHSLVGYGFIPFLLVAALSVFPFTLLESLAAGLAMLGLLAFSQTVDGSWLTGRGVENFWLLSSLLVVSLAANHFQLSLLLRLYRQATHDPLTGLFNRGALEVHLEKIQAWQRETEGQDSLGHVPCSLLMLDLDHFKRINDSYGHSVGDGVLCQFAELLVRQTRRHDCVARYGGEEFVIILVGSGPARALEVAERIRFAVEKTEFRGHDDEPIPVTTSIGVTRLEQDEPPREALRRADEALYRAKREGRNQVISAMGPASP